MPPTPLYPMAFEPLYKSLIWGGRRLETMLGKAIGGGPSDRVAESWELADHRDDRSRVRNGPLAGASLHDLARDRPDDVYGPGRAPAGGGRFPLLVKFLDAHDVLSVQVHPDDALGRRLAGDNGKTEAWVIVHAEPDSLIYAGLRPGVSRERFAKALAAGGVEPLLHRFPARAGDCVFIPAGTVHAIGAGVVLAEVQQSSDTTFRVHDWDRLGPDGRGRTLHHAEALESTDFDAGPVEPVRPAPAAFEGGTREELVRCRYFHLDRLRIDGPATVGGVGHFTIAVGLGGGATVEDPGGVAEPVPVGLGRTALLPASVGPCRVVPEGTGAVLLTCVVPRG